MKALFPLLILLGSLTAAAQDMDTLPDWWEVEQNYGPGKSKLMATARTRLMDALLEDNDEAVKYLYFYLANGIEDEYYQPLHFQEKVLLACLIGRHDLAMREIARLDSISQLPPRQRPLAVEPQQDMLWNVVYDQAHAHLETLYQGIDRTALPAEQRQVLALTVKKLLETGTMALIYIGENKQKELNEACDAFLAAHPHSEYGSFVRRFLRQIAKSTWGFGAHWGGGYSGQTTQLAQVFPGYGAMCLGIEGAYWRFVLGAWCNLGGAPDTRTDLLYSDRVTWPKGTSTSPFNISIDLGFRAVDAPSWTLTPFVGYGHFECEPNESTIDNYPELKGRKLNQDNALTFGFNLDYKLLASSSATGTVYWPVRLRATYYKAFNQPIRGDMFTVTLSIGFFGQIYKQVY